MRRGCCRCGHPATSVKFPTLGTKDAQSGSQTATLSAVAFPAWLFYAGSACLLCYSKSAEFPRVI